MDKLMKSKKVMFVLAMLSLVGVIIGLDEYYLEDGFEKWLFWSLPLIVQLIYVAIFRGSSKSD